MSERQADLVIQIAVSEASPAATVGSLSGESNLAAELRRRLEPGTEIALSCDGLRAITSIVWIDDLPLYRTFHAGVRLLAVSSQPEDITS
jgi:hypothetical protein